MHARRKLPAYQHTRSRDSVQTRTPLLVVPCCTMMLTILRRLFWNTVVAMLSVRSNAELGGLRKGSVAFWARSRSTLRWHSCSASQRQPVSATKYSRDNNCLGNLNSILGDTVCANKHHCRQRAAVVLKPNLLGSEQALNLSLPLRNLQLGESGPLPTQAPSMLAQRC